MLGSLLSCTMHLGLTLHLDPSTPSLSLSHIHGTALMRNRIPHHLILFVVFYLFTRALSADPMRPAPAQLKVGVILDMKSSVGSMSRTCMDMAISDFYSANPNSSTRLHLLHRHSPHDVVTAASSAVDLLINEHVQAIIGPQSSPEAEFVADIGNVAHTPILSSSATSPSLSLLKPGYFIRTAPRDDTQAQPIAAIISAFGWRRAVLIYEDNEFGSPLIPYLIDALDSVNTHVAHRLAIPAAASGDSILAELYKMKTMATRLFVVHVTSALAPRLFAGARDAGMMNEGFVWIITAGLTSLLGSLDPLLVHDSMQGVIGVKPYIPTPNPRFREFKKRWRVEFLKENPTADVPELSAFGVWAYDTVWALATAAEEVGPVDRVFNQPMARNSTTDLSGIVASESGEKLLDSIWRTEFEGLGGKFQLVQGELKMTGFQIVNVIMDKGRDIGFWTSRHGLTRKLNRSSTRSYSASTEGLGVVIWPGESTVVPRGWVDPTSGRRLRVGVPWPVSPGFQSFINMDVDQATNVTTFSGFVIEVFEEAVRQLPYALPFEYIATDTNNYDHLVQLVSSGIFDAVVGDVTITANRSMHVDFTLPYTTSGVQMLVPLKVDNSKNAWIFLDPLTGELWIVSGAFFVFTGAVVWALEHKINTEFRGPPTHQLGTVFYFTFSTLVFAHREKIMNNLTKIVMIIWVFVVLVLQSSYTASLTSSLTVQQLHPTFTQLSELINGGHNVGYLESSFVRGFLIKKGFDPSKLRPYTSPQQYEEALSNGAIAAVVDELCYLKVFLKDRCDNFTITGQAYKTGGFGFVFPKGSPLVPDMSRAILNIYIKEGKSMVQIERAWFGDEVNCADQGSTISPSHLNFRSFWGLFLITGTASFLSLLIFLASFLFTNKHRLLGNTSSISKRLCSIARRFDERDHSSHTFKKDDGQGYECASPLSVLNPLYQEDGNAGTIMNVSREITSPSIEMISLPAPC